MTLAASDDMSCLDINNVVGRYFNSVALQENENKGAVDQTMGAEKPSKALPQEY